MSKEFERDVGWREEVPKSKGPQAGYGHLKVTFEYKLNSKEGPSCFDAF